MIRLMCSQDRQELEGLESRLSRAGVRFEIRGNPLTAALGITRHELHVEEGDLQVASDICQGLAAGGEENAPGNDLRDARGYNGFVDSSQSELEMGNIVASSPTTESARDNGPDRRSETCLAEPEGDLARATDLLGEEVEALLAREMMLANRCAALEDKVKSLDEALADTRENLAREVSNRSGVEKRLTDAIEVRVSLEKEMRALELRLKASEQALAATQVRLDSEAQQREQLIKERQEKQVQMETYVGTVNELRSRVRARTLS